MENRPYRSIDHIMIRVADVEPLFSLFSRTLGLPVSWPLQRSEFASFGWVTVGNTELEFWAAANNFDLPPDLGPPIFHGFALNPAELSTSISVLAERGIQCKTPRPYRTKNDRGELVTNFTNAVIQDVSSDSCCVFLCEWNPDGTIFPWKEKLTSTQRRLRNKNLLDACHGGQLGIIGLAEICLSSPRPDESAGIWRKVSGSENEPIQLTEDISLHVVSGQSLIVSALVFRVRSLSKAKTFLAENNLLGTVSPSRISLAPALSCGLDFSFIEAAASHYRE